MQTSEAINEIATALAKAQGEMGGAVKDSANPFFKSKYADLASVWEACRGPLSKNGLAVLQSPSVSRDEHGAYVAVETRLMHASGQWFCDTIIVAAKEDSPQAVGSAITYLRRYALQSFAGVAPEDDDAEAAHGRSNGNGHAKPQAAQSQGATGDLGPLVVEKLNPGRAGALAEVVFTNGDAVMTWKKPVHAAAGAALKTGHSVMVTIKTSTSGNRYLDEMKSTGMNGAQLAATKFQADTPIDSSEIPF
jgi:hypothetical protein